MEVLDADEALLSNHEVLQLLNEHKKTQDSKKKEPKNFATIRYETVKYLEDTPCKYQTDDAVREFLLQLKEKDFRLTKAEKLQIVNHRPTTLVELQLLVEENEERFSEEAMNEILEIVEKTLPSADAQEAEDEEQEMAVIDDDEHQQG